MTLSSDYFNKYDDVFESESSTNSLKTDGFSFDNNVELHPEYTELPASTTLK